MKTELCVLVWKENISVTELFENNDVTIIRLYVCPSLPQTLIQSGGRNGDSHVDFATWVQPKPCYAHAYECTQAFLPPVIVTFSNFFGVVWSEKHLMRFQSETSAFKFLWRSVDGALLSRILFAYIGNAIHSLFNSAVDSECA